MPGGNLTNYKFYKFCTQQNFPIIHLKDDAWYHSICFEAFSLIIPSHIIKKLIPVAFRVDMMEFLFNDFIYKCVVVPTGSYSEFYSKCTQIDFLF